MTLKQYISQLGDAKAAKLFGISERTARSYRAGQRKPRPQVALLMVKKSKGQISIAEIYS